MLVLGVGKRSNDANKGILEGTILKKRRGDGGFPSLPNLTIISTSVCISGPFPPPRRKKVTGSDPKLLPGTKESIVPGSDHWWTVVAHVGAEDRREDRLSAPAVRGPGDERSREFSGCLCNLSGPL